MALEAGQFQIGDLVMGAGTDYTVLDDFNPWAVQSRVDQSTPRSWDHGSWSGAEWRDEFVVPMRIRVRNQADGSPGGWLNAHQRLAAAFAPRHTDTELRWTTGGVEYMMRGRPRMVEPEVTTIRRGYTITRCAFAALDPRIYSGVEQVASVGLPSSVGGLTWPVTTETLSATGFETDTSGWTVNSGGSVVRSTAQAHSGVASLLYTPDGAAAVGEVRSPNAAGVVAGRAYRAAAWVRCAAGRSVNVNIVWRDASAAFLASAGAVSVSVLAGTWTPIEVSGVAPASAAQAQISVSMGGTPPSSDLLYIDDVALTRVGGGLTWPVTWDAVVSSGVIQVHNAGTVAARPRLVIYGPCTKPRVSLVGAGRTLAWDLTLAAGQWLDVDTDRRTSLINGQVSRSGQMTSRQWFELPPGQSEIAFNADVYDPAAALHVAYRSAW